MLLLLGYNQKYIRCNHQRNYLDWNLRQKEKRTFTKMLSKSGPKMEPCGTPATISCQELKLQFKRTPFFLLPR